jgi:GDPmannose 4,6-dehydratase
MRALITGITGQDGSYLAEFLLEKGYEVYGIVRRSSLEKFDRIEAITEKIRFVEGDLTDQSSLDQALQQLKPDELYNLAAQSFVPVSWNQPVLTADVTGLGALRVMEAIRKHSPQTKFLQASSSEMFGKVLEKPQTEKTPFHPRSPYGVD